MAVLDTTNENKLKFAMNFIENALSASKGGDLRRLVSDLQQAEQKVAEVKNMLEQSQRRVA